MTDNEYLKYLNKLHDDGVEMFDKYIKEKEERDRKRKIYLKNYQWVHNKSYIINREKRVAKNATEKAAKRLNSGRIFWLYHILEWFIRRYKNVCRTLHNAHKYKSKLNRGPKLGKTGNKKVPKRPKTIPPANIDGFTLRDIWNYIFIPSMKLHGSSMNFCAIQHEEYSSAKISGTL